MTNAGMVKTPGMPSEADYSQLEVNLPLRYLKRTMHEDKIQLGTSKESWESYQKAMWTAYHKIKRNPKLLDKYQLNITKNYKSLETATQSRKLPLWEKLLYYRANPWLFVTDVIGKENIQKTAPVGTEFLGFMLEQKEFMRDALDPRRGLLVLRCNRGGSKTFLIGLIVLIFESIIPKMRITIQAGSQEQSDKVYSDYFRPFLEGSVLEHLVITGKDGKPRIFRKHTAFKHGGWVKALTASQKSVRGPRPDLLIIDEMCSTEREFCYAAFGGVVTSSDIKIIVSSTPDKIAHMFYDINKKSDADAVLGDRKWKLYHWDCYVCPWITESAIQYAKEELFDSNEFRISMLGEFGSSTGLVYPLEKVEQALCTSYPFEVTEWMREMKNEFFLKVVIGIDWGFAHKGCITVVGLGKDAHLYLLDSFGISGSATKGFRDEVLARAVTYGASEILCDGSNPAEIKNLRDDIYRDELHLPVRALPFNKYKYMMITEVRRRLEMELMHIDTGLGHNDELGEQMRGYEFASSNIETGGVSEKTVKINDDYLDSLDCAVWAFKPSSMAMVLGGADATVTKCRSPRTEVFNTQRSLGF